jgi:subtilisin family serine protease
VTPRAVPMLAALALTTACAHQIQHAIPVTADPGALVEADILVTFPMISDAPMVASGSRRSYHSGAGWAVPLHTRQQARRFARDHGLLEVDGWPIELLGVYCVAYRTGDKPADATVLARLRQDPRAELVQPNALFTGMTTATDRAIYDDPLLEVAYGEFVGRLAALHAITGGEQVRIGVIDTSVDLAHPDLSGQVTRQVEFVAASSVEERLHGTAVTGVIAAAAGNGEGLVGIAPRADVHIYGACMRAADSTLCSSFSIAQALAEAIEAGMDVINMSFAGPEDPLLTALLDKALTTDTVLVAAGNAEAPEHRFPAGLPGVFAADAEHDLWFASPERLSTRAGGSYQVFFGSSIASAGMTGLAALVRSQASATDTRSLLTWLFGSDCSATAPPLTACPIRPEQLCD